MNLQQAQSKFDKYVVNGMAMDEMKTGLGQNGMKAVDQMASLSGKSQEQNQDQKQTQQADRKLGRVGQFVNSVADTISPEKADPSRTPVAPPNKKDQKQLPQFNNKGLQL